MNQPSLDRAFRDGVRQSQFLTVLARDEAVRRFAAALDLDHRPRGAERVPLREALGRVLAAPILHLGIGLASDRIHAPNEGVDLDQIGRGVLAAGELWRELAALPC